LEFVLSISTIQQSNLPYDFELDSLAEDWWTFIDQGWANTGQFGE
jgi:hypothetical protein